MLPQISTVAHHVLAKPQQTRVARWAAPLAFLIGLSSCAASAFWLRANVIALLVNKSSSTGVGLTSWSEFGQAAAAPLALANLGIVVISAYYVVRSLDHAEAAVKMAYQPLVACSVALGFELIGEKRAPHARISDPQLNLLVQNLGDSTATFIEIDILQITFYNVKGEATSLIPTLSQKRVLLDHLGVKGEAGFYTIPIINLREITSVASRKEYRSNFESLLSSILMLPVAQKAESPTHSDSGIRGRLRCWIRELGRKAGVESTTVRLECRIQFAHHNVVALAYRGGGTMIWDCEVMRKSPCDPLQIEFIENFKNAIASCESAWVSGVSADAASNQLGDLLTSPRSLLGVVQSSPSYLAALYRRLLRTFHSLCKCIVRQS